jgi:hypothetical protein
MRRTNQNFFLSVRDNDEEEVKNLLDGGQDVNTLDDMVSDKYLSCSYTSIVCLSRSLIIVELHCTSYCICSRL